MPARDEPTSFNVWGTPIVDIESAVNALPDEDEEDGENVEVNSDDDTSTPTPPVEQATVGTSAEESFAAWKKEMLAELAEGKGEMYTGLQKVVAKKDQQIDKLSQLVDKMNVRLEEYAEQFESLGEGFNWVSDTVLDALPDATKERATSALSKKDLELRQKRLERATAKAKAAQEANPEPEQEDPAVTAYKAKFLEGRRSRAKKAGLDPDDAALDYGSADDPIATRIEKFESSLDAALEAADKKRQDAVSAPVTAPATRGTGGSAPTVASRDGRSNLERGSVNRLNELRKLSGI